jgi:hypothetical protein
MTAMTFHPIRYPLGLVYQPNGELNVQLLKPVGFNEFLYSTAADWFMHLKAEFEATRQRVLNFTHGGCYRTYESQKALFLRRYEQINWATYVATTGRDKKIWPAINPADPHCADNPSKTYWRVKVAYNDPTGRPHYYAAAATPGFSNHGLGLAIDLAIGLPSSPVSLNADDIEWLKVNVGRFGFTYESAAEPWHITYYIADDCPPYMGEKH